jgi:hypothetical protein
MQSSSTCSCIHAAAVAVRHVCCRCARGCRMYNRLADVRSPTQLDMNSTRCSQLPTAAVCACNCSCMYICLHAAAGAVSHPRLTRCSCSIACPPCCSEVCASSAVMRRLPPASTECSAMRPSACPAAPKAFSMPRVSAPGASCMFMNNQQTTHCGQRVPQHALCTCHFTSCACNSCRRTPAATNTTAAWHTLSPQVAREQHMIREP